MRLHLLLAVTALLGGCKVSPAGKVESGTVNFIKHHITVGNKKLKNPFESNSDNLATGKEAFGHYCVACHGIDGQNTGVPFAEKMSPPLPLLTSSGVQSYTDGQLKWIIDNGIAPSGMPASKGTLSEDEIWTIVVYLRHLPPAGSVGEPEMYSH
ncbi:mono/diheme cytochrome c family protein [Granulicella aggregans]|uniref:Mono/diheme cytochrome c family protein n=2 Tax=Granulicella aggregans TaxID=474949 RepID=A0A7W8E6W6_9BACT|nr:mono/diheme cytochrome c family protein [Granulicella aggregans]